VFGIGMSEMLIILAVALLVFGPNKLPEIAKSIAKGLRELQRAGDDLRASVNLDLDDKPRPRPRPMPPPPEPPAQIAGSELTGPELAHGAPSPSGDASGGPPQPAPPATSASPSSAAPSGEVWPRPAEGTLAQGTPIDDEPQNPQPPKVG
jgi:TatA/E family protein of Tat protein translocase